MASVVTSVVATGSLVPLRLFAPSANTEYPSPNTNTMVTAKVIDETGGTLRNGLPSLQDLNFPILRKGVNHIEIAAENATFTELKIQAKSRWR